jgi:hypothetical protein
MLLGQCWWLLGHEVGSALAVWRQSSVLLMWEHQLRDRSITIPQSNACCQRLRCVVLVAWLVLDGTWYVAASSRNRSVENSPDVAPKVPAAC